MTTDFRAEGAPILIEGNDVGVLLSHGYTGTTSSMRYLAQRLNETEGWTIHCPRLAGHGETSAAMAQTTAQDWIRSLDEGLLALSSCRTVFMAGLSMGGCLTLYMAAKHPQRIAAIVPINACLSFGNPTLAELALADDAPQYLSGVGNDVKDPGVVEAAYRDIPVQTLKEIYALMNVTRDLLERVHCPTLVMVSPDDHVVPPDNAAEILARIASIDRRQLLLRDSFHVATIDHDKELIAEQTRRFFVEQLGRQDILTN